VTDELVIDEKNFSQYFRDVRRNKPERGDVIARFVAEAELVDGQLKRDLISLLKLADKAIPATNVMRKLGCATEGDANRVCREMCEDLCHGMSDDEVVAKVYGYQLEAFFYVRKEYVPTSDPHWSIISILNLDEFVDAAGDKLDFNWNFVEPPPALEKTPLQ
jgi:hypothetical protein